MKIVACFTFLLSLFTACSADTLPQNKIVAMDTTKIIKSDEEWKKELSPEQYRILREKGTERAFTGVYWDNHANGIYKCAACKTDLFSSSEKFDSGCGWPSFTMPFDSSTCDYTRDKTYGMERTEVTCRTCGGHLGHVFDDGPPPNNQRYCINSGSLIFVKE